MSYYENLVMKTQENYSRYYSMYASGKTPIKLSRKKALDYQAQICLLYTSRFFQRRPIDNF